MKLRLLGTLLLAHLTTDIGQGMLPALFPFFIADRGLSIFSTGGNLGIATGPLVITPLVLAFGLKASLVPLLPVLLVVSAIPIVAVAIALTLPDSRTVAGSSPTPV